MLFCICPRTSRTPKFWHTYVIKYGDFMVILEPCYPRNDPKNQNFLKMKKMPGDIFLLRTCDINEDHMIYGYWNRRCDRQNFFCHLVHFLPFHPLTTWKIKTFEKLKKNNWIYYHFTHVHHTWQSYDVWFLRYGAWQTEVFVILGHFLPFYSPPLTTQIFFEKIQKNVWRSLYTSVPKFMIIWYTVPEIWRVTDVVCIFHFGLFFALLPPAPVPQQPPGTT